MSRLSEKLQRKERVITAEITPPKGAGLKKFRERTEILRPSVDALNVTDCQRSLVRMSSMAASRVLVDMGVEPVFQLTCRDRNLIAIQADLMGASALGIPNLICLTGDPVKVGDCTKAKSVFEFETTGLLKVVQALQSGRDTEGHKMNAPTKFFVGAVVNPTLRIGRSQLDRMGKKVELGAKFFQTQANYDIDDFEKFVDEAQSLQAPILAGILLLNSYEMAKFIQTEIPGIHMPDHVLQRFEGKPEDSDVGVDHAVETMLRLESKVAGFHLMSIRAEEKIPLVLERYYERSTIK